MPNDLNAGTPFVPGMTSIVILTRNALDYTKQCMDSIMKHTPESYEVVFIDNGSVDDTVSYLQTIPNSQLIVNSMNKGFAYGCNQGMAAARGEYIVLLNNDTVVTKGWLTRLLTWLQKDESIGIVGPRSNYVFSAQRVQPVSYQSMEEMAHFAEFHTMMFQGSGFEAERLVGFCMAFHRRLIEQIGGMDDQFFPGCYEDDDFCLRTQISGKRLWIASDVFIHHHGHISFRTNGEDVFGSVMRENGVRFWAKWGLTDRYVGSEIVQREKPFQVGRHYVPLRVD
ncbi:Glycosyltransferase, GT2 family [Paenibacillus sp. 1_12]|uniref:glycosyltransferase family 2 protein n=1 Tax=Paenibacillus sp. 1_12 TaxID=1566278 RepID=UPI0008E96280|nr:glycosyltransferase family 2 protein [Paenibacillus sp. 1_12]SFK72182.1 Glycosyltransferase, GT2 family [Paenibacillus sp. 1_12]